MQEPLPKKKLPIWDKKSQHDLRRIPKLLPIRVLNIDMENYYKKSSPPNLGWDDLCPNFRSFDGSNIKTWNIDGCFEG